MVPAINALGMIAFIAYLLIAQAILKIIAVTFPSSSIGRALAWLAF